MSEWRDPERQEIERLTRERDEAISELARLRVAGDLVAKERNELLREGNEAFDRATEGRDSSPSRPTL